MTLCWCEHGAWASAAAALAGMSSLNDSIFFLSFFFFLKFAKNFHLNSWSIQYRKENQTRERQELEKTKRWRVGGTDKMIRGEREREREKGEQLKKEESKGLPCQDPTTNVSKWFKFRVNVEQWPSAFSYRLYRYVCARIFIESRLACLATDINMISNDTFTLPFLLTLEQVSVTFRQLPNLPVFCGGRGGGGSEQNTGMPVFW